MDQEFKDEFLLDDPEGGGDGMDMPDTDEEADDEEEEAPADETM